MRPTAERTSGRRWKRASGLAFIIAAGVRLSSRSGARSRARSSEERSSERRRSTSAAVPVESLADFVVAILEWVVQFGGVGGGVGWDGWRSCT